MLNRHSGPNTRVISHCRTVVASEEKAAVAQKSNHIALQSCAPVKPDSEINFTPYQQEETATKLPCSPNLCSTNTNRNKAELSPQAKRNSQPPICGRMECRNVHYTPSRGAAKVISPGRKPWVGTHRRESRRDDTVRSGRQPTSPSPPLERSLRPPIAPFFASAWRPLNGRIKIPTPSPAFPILNLRNARAAAHQISYRRLYEQETVGCCSCGPADHRSVR